MPGMACVVAALILIITACNSPNTISSPSPEGIGDPLGIKDSPTMVSYKNIQKIHQPDAPHYPSDARAKGIQGDVLVEVWIREDGIPFKSAALFGPKELQQCAADYVLTWKFAPYLTSGKPTPVLFRMVMPFQLREGGPYRYFPKKLLN